MNTKNDSTKRFISVLFGIAFAVLLDACSKPDVDANGVPKIASAEHPVVDGKAMTPEEFWAKYCKDKPETTFDPICAGVKTVVNQHSFTHPAHLPPGF